LDGEARARDGYRARLAELEAQLALQHSGVPTRSPRPVDGDVLDLFVETNPGEQVVAVPTPPQSVPDVPEQLPVGEQLGPGNDAIPDPTGIVASTPPTPAPRTLIGAGAVATHPVGSDRVTEDLILSHLCLKMTTVRRTIVNLHIAQRHLEAYMTKHCSDWTGARKLAMRDSVSLRWLDGEGDELMMAKAIGDHNQRHVPFDWLYRAILGKAGLKQAQYWYKNHRLEGRAMTQSSPLLRYRWHILAANLACYAAFVHAVRKGRFKIGVLSFLGVISGSILSKFLFKYDTQVIPLD